MSRFGYWPAEQKCVETLRWCRCEQWSQTTVRSDCWRRGLQRLVWRVTTVWLMIRKDCTPCLKKNCANLFLFVKIFGMKIAERTSFSEVYSFSTSPNLCQRTTVWNADVQNCCYNPSKFGKVMTKNKFAQFFLRHGVVNYNVYWPRLLLTHTLDFSSDTCRHMSYH